MRPGVRDVLHRRIHDALRHRVHDALRHKIRKQRLPPPTQRLPAPPRPRRPPPPAANQDSRQHATGRVQEHGGETILPFSCALEQKLVDMPKDEAAKYCAENQITRMAAECARNALLQRTISTTKKIVQNFERRKIT